MVNHYLLTLTPDQEHRVLTHKMSPGCYSEQASRGPCLVGVACAEQPHPTPQFPRGWFRAETIEDRYDGLCERFGVGRTNRVIRDRILANIARRTLQRDAVPAMEAV